MGKHILLFACGQQHNTKAMITFRLSPMKQTNLNVFVNFALSGKYLAQGIIVTNMDTVACIGQTLLQAQGLHRYRDK